VSSWTTNLGLITRINDGWMEIKVSLLDKCSACANKSMCTFSGPENAYQTFRVPRVTNCRVGDRVLVQVPGTRLAMTALVMIALPLVLLLSGYALRDCCMRFPYATLLLALIGIALWIAAMYGANRWMERNIRFQERVYPVKDLMREPNDTAANSGPPL